MMLKDFIFRDKASLVLRALFKEPKTEWTVRKLTAELGLSLGLVSKVLTELRDEGYIKGTHRGPDAGAILRNNPKILDQWTRFYNYERNKIRRFYSPDPNILKGVKTYFAETKNKGRYALTLNSGANLMTTHVKDPNIYFYFQSEKFDEDLLSLNMALDLKELKRGGNVFVIRPYYKNSVFYNLQRIQGFPVVSNLQLYLDLFHYPVRGQEQTEMLLRHLKEEGKELG